MQRGRWISRNFRLAAVAALVGAISLAPTELRSADAVVSARAIPTSISVTAGTAKVVAGLTSGATATGPLTLSAITTSSCSASTTVTAKVTAAQTIFVASATGISIGNIITAAGGGVPANTRVTGITGLTLTLSANVTLAKNDPVAFQGCFQQFFSVNNIGSIALLAFSISQTSASASPTGISIQRCSGTWMGGSSAMCSGGTISTLFTNFAGPLATSAFTSISGTFPTGAQAKQLRAVCDRSGQTTQINVRVSTATDLRAGITTNG